MKLRVKMILVMMMVLCTTMTVNGFSDVKDSDWFFESIENMKESKIISGYPDGTFKPQNTVTYGEFIKLITVATTGKDIGNSTTGHWSESYYNKAIEMGLFTETDISKERLDDGISREFMALLISNNFKDIEVKNYDLIQDIIRDLNLSQNYQDEIIRAYGLGIIEGYAKGEFRPSGTLTRAESTTVINRILNEDQRVVPRFNEAGERIVTFSYPNWDETFETTLRSAKLGDYGIEKIEITPQGYVAIYSTVRYDVIRLLIENVMTSTFFNANGTSYWEEDGYYVYFAQPEKDGIDVTGKTPTLSFSGSGDDAIDDAIYEFIDVTL